MIDVESAEIIAEEAGMRLGISAEKVLSRIKEHTDGHCPCVPSLMHGVGTYCPCVKFRTMKQCHCGLFVGMGEY